MSIVQVVGPVRYWTSAVVTGCEIQRQSMLAIEPQSALPSAICFQEKVPPASPPWGSHLRSLTREQEPPLWGDLPGEEHCHPPEDLHFLLQVPILTEKRPQLVILEPSRTTSACALNVQPTHRPAHAALRDTKSHSNLT